MKRFSALCAAFTLAAFLVGCTPSASLPPETSSPEPSVTAPLSGDTEDPVLLTTGLASSSALLTVNGAPISAELYIHWLLYNISYYDSYMQYYYGTSLDWAEESGGQTLSDYLKEDSRNAVIYFSVLAAKAEELGCNLTAAQQQELAETRLSMIEELGGDEEYQYNLNYAIISDEALTSVNSNNYIYNNLLDYYFGGENAPTTEDLTDYVNETGLLSAKHILIMTQDESGMPLEGDALASATERAETLLTQLLAADEGERAALFDELMHEYSEDTGLAGYPDGYTFGANEMVPEFESATRALEIGAMTDYLVQTEYGYHIILRLQPELSDDLISEYGKAKLDDLATLWMTEAVVVDTPEYEAIDPQTVYEAILAYRAELEAAHGDTDAAETP